MLTNIQDSGIGHIPPDVEKLGRPDAIFRAKALAGTAIGVALLAGAVLMLLSGAGALYGYFNADFPKDGPPAEIVLGVGVVSLVISLVLFAVVLRSPSGRSGDEAFNGFLVYPSALVRLKASRCDIFPWEEIAAIVNPERAFADYQILSRNGRKVPVDRAIDGYTDLLGTILARLKGPLLNGARSQVAAGGTVKFGPFGLSRDAIEHNGKHLRWDDMSVFEIMVQQGGHRRLRIKRRGTILPWCFALLYGLPNEAVFFTLTHELRSGQ